MATITIPRGLEKKDKLIAVSPEIYEEFLDWQRKIKSARTFKPTTAEKRALTRARKDFKEGKYITLRQLEDELDSLRRK